MTGLQWLVVIWWSLNGLAHVAIIGRERKTVTPLGALGNVIVYAVLITLALTVLAPK